MTGFLRARHPGVLYLPDEGRLPGFGGGTEWIGPPPDVTGKVVLVDFWTFTCVNWLRTLPYLRAWQEKYGRHGLVIVGVHTPEFDVEHDPGNVRRAVERLRVPYPVVLDGDYAIWTAFGNRYWPALYLADARGRIRHHHFGEGEYDSTEMVLQHLLKEAGAGGAAADPVSVDPEGVEVAADWDDLRSPENYLGSDRTTGLVPATAPLRLNQWSLDGDWTVRPEAVVLDAGPGTVTYRFHARDLNLVLAPSGPDRPVRFRVRLDGDPPGAAGGADVDEDGAGTIGEPRLYQLLRQPQPIADRTAEITFLDPGVRAYAATFG